MILSKFHREHTQIYGLYGFAKGIPPVDALNRMIWEFFSIESD